MVAVMVGNTVTGGADGTVVGQAVRYINCTVIMMDATEGSGIDRSAANRMAGCTCCRPCSGITFSQPGITVDTVVGGSYSADAVCGCIIRSTGMAEVAIVGMDGFYNFFRSCACTVTVLAVAVPGKMVGSMTAVQGSLQSVGFIVMTDATLDIVKGARSIINIVTGRVAEAAAGSQEIVESSNQVGSRVAGIGICLPICHVIGVDSRSSRVTGCASACMSGFRRSVITGMTAGAFR